MLDFNGTEGWTPKYKTRGGLILLGTIVVFSVLSLTGVVYALNSYFTINLTTTVQGTQIITITGISSSGLNSGVSACSTLPSSAKSTGQTLSCSLSVTQGDVGTITITLHTNSGSGFPVTVTASSGDADLTITNPSSASVTTGSSQFVINLAVSQTATLGSTSVSITVAA